MSHTARVCPLRYTADQLYDLSKDAQPLNRDVRRRVREVFNGRYRGRRAGRATQARRLSPRLRPVGNGAFVVVGNRPSRARVDKHWRPCVTSISVPRCAEAVGRA